MECTYDIAFVVDTRQYSGNFEREMTAYVTGREGEFDTHISNIVIAIAIEMFNQEVFDKEILDELLDKKCEGTHVEYQEVGCAICPTPGRTNNGAGVQTDITPENPKIYDAYESVAMFFSEVPSDKLIAFMKDRAIKYGKINDLTIIGFRLLTQKTVITETELVL